MPDVDGDVEAGATIVNVSWAGTGVFLGGAIAAALAPDLFRLPFAVLSVLLFVVGCAAFLGAFVRAVQRSRREEIAIGGVYFLSGSAPRVVRQRLLLSFGLEVLAAVVAAGVRPYTAVAFGVLAPVFGLGLAGLWGARHGDFPAREPGPR
jgi:hypothetical protein